MTERTCPNCDQVALGRFCTKCGQDNIRPRLEARGILAEGLSSLVGWESALGLTARGVVCSPGALAADYVAGHRRRYVNPVRFCLLSLAVWFLATRAAGLNPLDVSGLKITNSSGGHTDLFEDLRAFIGGHLDVLLFLSLPLRAFLLRLFFWRSGRNLAECLVVVLYVSGFGYLLGLVITPLHALGADWASNIRPLISVIWTILAARTFFSRGVLASSWRVVAVSLLHMFGTVILFGSIAIPWVLWMRG